MWRRAVAVCARAPGFVAAGRAGAAVNSPSVPAVPLCRRYTASAHALVEQYISEGVLLPDDIEQEYLSTLAKLPREKAIAAVEEFVEEAGGTAARKLGVKQRRELLDLIVRPLVDEEAEKPWEWQSYDDISHETTDVEGHFVNHSAPPNSRYTTIMDPDTEPEVLVPTHFEKVSLTMVGFDYSLLDSYVELIQRASKACDIQVTGRVPLPTKIEKYTVLSGPHVHKEHRDQFETRTHRRLLSFTQLSGSTASAFLDYIVRLCPPGVELRLTHTTVEAPDGELANRLGMRPVPNIAAMTHEIERALSADVVPQLASTLQEYSRTGSVASLASLPTTIRSHVRLCAGLREFLNSESDKAAFDAFVESGLWPDGGSDVGSAAETVTSTSSEIESSGDIQEGQPPRDSSKRKTAKKLQTSTPADGAPDD